VGDLFVPILYLVTFLVSFASHPAGRLPVRKLWLIVLVAGACSRGQPTVPETAPRLAVQQFMAAVKAQDLQGISAVWGTSKGLARDGLSQAELDRRLLLIQRCYNHDSFRIVEETPAPDGKRYLRLAVVRGRITKSPNFLIVRGPVRDSQGRTSTQWLVEDADYASMQELCRTSP
jgi:hypothetical protein